MEGHLDLLDDHRSGCADRQGVHSRPQLQRRPAVPALGRGWRAAYFEYQNEIGPSGTWTRDITPFIDLEPTDPSPGAGAHRAPAPGGSNSEGDHMKFKTLIAASALAATGVAGAASQPASAVCGVVLSTHNVGASSVTVDWADSDVRIQAAGGVVGPWAPLGNFSTAIAAGATRHHRVPGARRLCHQPAVPPRGEPRCRRLLRALPGRRPVDAGPNTAHPRRLTLALQPGVISATGTPRPADSCTVAMERPGWTAGFGALMAVGSDAGGRGVEVLDVEHESPERRRALRQPVRSTTSTISPPIRWKP